MSMELLYIENEPDVAKSTIRMLKRFGFAVEWAMSVAGAIDYLETDAQYIGVLSDYRLDDGTGADVLDWMRSHPTRQALVDNFVFLSGGGDQRLAAELNVTTLEKPISAVELKVALAVQFGIAL